MVGVVVVVVVVVVAVVVLEELCQTERIQRMEICFNRDATDPTDEKLPQQRLDAK